MATWSREFTCFTCNTFSLFSTYGHAISQGQVQVSPLKSFLQVWVTNDTQMWCEITARGSSARTALGTPHQRECSHVWTPNTSAGTSSLTGPWLSSRPTPNLLLPQPSLSPGRVQIKNLGVILDYSFSTPHIQSIGKSCWFRHPFVSEIWPPLTTYFLRLL